MRRRLYLLLAFAILSINVYPQGVGIPSKRGGIGFGNLARFTGIRLNFADKNVEKIVGINTTVWTTKHDSAQTGTMTGLSIGLPLAMGHENQRGVSVGLFGVAAKENLTGINIAGIGAGAGNSMTGINIAGLGIGAGENLTGINIALVGAGAGGKMTGFNFGGVGIGSGGSVAGVSIGGVGVGAGENLSGITLALVGVGAGENLTGLTAALVGVGAGEKVKGITVGGIAVGAGEELSGLTLAAVGIGSPRVNGIAAALAVGGVHLKGIMIAPAFLRVGSGDRKKNSDEQQSEEEGSMTGLSISAYNRIKGEQKGVALGVVNYTKRIKGFQFGVINIVRENPRGLRVLPVFNTRFGKR